MTHPESIKRLSEHHFEQAAHWYLKLRSELSADELRHWNRWSSTPENLAALKMVRRVSHQRRLQRLKPPDDEAVSADLYDGSVSVSEWLVRQARVEQQAARDSYPPRSRQRSAFATASGFLAIALVIGIGVWRASPDSTEAPLQFQTQAGEHRAVVLSDGSTVTLGALTTMSAQYSTDRRVITFGRGEALFDVAHNRNRPFIVLAAGRAITAVGTQFNVRSELDRVTVTVTEGIVLVAPTDESQLAAKLTVAPVRAPVARLVKGQDVTFSRSETGAVVGVADPGATEWLSGRLVYRDGLLRDVAADVARYYAKRFMFEDVTAGECHFSGIIDPSRVGDWVGALERIFPVKVTPFDDGPIVIRSRPGAEVDCRAYAP